MGDRRELHNEGFAISTHLSFFISFFHSYSEGYAVEQLVEALRYKPEGRGFDSRWCHWNFSLM